MKRTGRGGKRVNAGRKPSLSKAVGQQIQRSFALEVLERLGELDIPGVSTPADLCIHLMKTDKARAPILFIDVINRAHGKPAQAVIAEGKLTIEVRELGSANHSAAEADAAAAIN